MDQLQLYTNADKLSEECYPGHKPMTEKEEADGTRIISSDSGGGALR
jgi:hypothetical protein